MSFNRRIPGAETVEADHLLLDLNGTVTSWGKIDERLVPRLAELKRQGLEVHLLSADTYGTLEGVAADLGVSAKVVADGVAKREEVEALGAERCVAIGNGANDAEMLSAARIGIAIVAAEGASTSALRSADVVCSSIGDAIDLLLDESGLAATLRT